MEISNSVIVICICDLSWSVNVVTNPNLVYKHEYTWQYINSPQKHEIWLTWTKRTVCKKCSDDIRIYTAEQQYNNIAPSSGSTIIIWRSTVVLCEKASEVSDFCKIGSDQTNYIIFIYFIIHCHILTDLYLQPICVYHLMKNACSRNR
jgi:hypothetical protein